MSPADARPGGKGGEGALWHAVGCSFWKLASKQRLTRSRGSEIRFGEVWGGWRCLRGLRRGNEDVDLIMGFGEAGVGGVRSGSAKGLGGHQRGHRGWYGGAYNSGRHDAGAVVEEDKSLGRVKSRVSGEAQFFKT